ncbi:MAG TPA: D-aminoacylase [Chloroflexota bacterium]
MSFDLIFRGATVYDGTGAPGRRLDVGLKDGRIAAVGDQVAGEIARRVVDAGDLALAPGFIDMHTHSDLTLPSFPEGAHSVGRGVTSEVVGNCGFSPAPVSDDPALADQLRAYVHGFGPDLDWSWSSFGSFLDRLDAVHPAVNVVPLVGHGALRIAVMGLEDREATPEERNAMRAGLAEAMAAGAWGMSSGLAYVPGSFADVDEVAHVAAAARQVDGLYTTHMRDEGDSFVPGIEEALTVGERLDIRLEISHLKVVGKRNHGRAAEALERLESARGRGLRVWCDVYPYTAGSTYLSQLLPAWAMEGGVEAMVGRLRSPDTRARIRQEMENGAPGSVCRLKSAGGWHNVMIANVVRPDLRWAEGGRVSELAQARGVEPAELALDLLVEDRGGSVMVLFSMDEADVQTILQDPACCIGSDQLGVTSAEKRVHPRAYGTSARVLGWAVRDAGILSMEEAIRKMTGLPAEILGMTDRGRVAPGMAADLVLFDPATVRDEATYEHPTRLASGIEHVLIGGEFAVERGTPVNLRLGRVLRH